MTESSYLFTIYNINFYFYSGFTLERKGKKNILSELAKTFLLKATSIQVRFVFYLKTTCGLFDGMSHHNAHGLVDIVHVSSDVATMELVGTHHLAGIML